MTSSVLSRSLTLIVLLVRETLVSTSSSVFVPKWPTWTTWPAVILSATKSDPNTKAGNIWWRASVKHRRRICRRRPRWSPWSRDRLSRTSVILHQGHILPCTMQDGVHELELKLQARCSYILIKTLLRTILVCRGLRLSEQKISVHATFSTSMKQFLNAKSILTAFTLQTVWRGILGSFDVDIIQVWLHLCWEKVIWAKVTRVGWQNSQTKLHQVNERANERTRGPLHTPEIKFQTNSNSSGPEQDEFCTPQALFGGGDVSEKRLDI